MTTAARYTTKSLKSAYEKMTAACNTKSVSMLKMTAKQLMSSTDEHATMAFTCVLNALESKISEAEFIEFCDSL